MRLLRQAKKHLGQKLLHISPPFHLSYWKWLRLLVLGSVDIILLVASYWGAYFLRLEDWRLTGYFDVFLKNIPFVVILNIFAFYAFGMYRQVWRYANFQTAILIGKCVFFGNLLAMMTSFLIGLEKTPPRSVPIAFWFIATMLITATKFAWRAWASFQSNISASSKERCLIYGAGTAGDLFARHMIANPNFPYTPVGFIDDDANKKGRFVHGIKVLGTGENLIDLVKVHKIDAVILCMHSVPGKVVRDVVGLCQKYGIKPKIMPDMANSLGVDIIQPRSVDVRDLLRRNPKPIDHEKVRQFFNGQRVLVTGAGGSIGSEICRQILRASPDCLIMLDSSEYNLYRIDNELRESFKTNTRFVSVLGNVCDRRSVDRTLQLHRPTCILHAAAYKHVPLVEGNPAEGVMNNVSGTKNLAEAAIEFGVKHFLLISTDKAVRPTNIMGASKRCCELIIQGFNELYSDHCKFAAVRFGNVLGSSGSVIPRFLEQIQAGGPITVTHPDVTRYFMLTSEAVGLVLQSIASSNGGEIFVLNMGEPVNIFEMAKQLVTLAGKVPGKDIEIEFTGLRPGEKLYEELIIDGAEQHSLHDDVYVATAKNTDYAGALVSVDQILELAKDGDVDGLREKLKQIADFDPIAGNLGHAEVQNSAAVNAAIQHLPLHAIPSAY